MNFIKKLVGEKKEKESSCCGVEIKEVESKEESCCENEEESGCC